MARLLPKALIQKLRRLHFFIVMRVEAAANILLELLPNYVAFGVPKNAALRFFLQMEQIHFAAQLAVVALFGFFHHMQIGFQIFFIAPACAVNTLQHFIIAVAAPIGTGQLGQLKGFAQLAGGRQMRATAQIFPCALPVHRNRLVSGNGSNNFCLIFFANLAELRHRFIAIPFFTDNLFIAVNDFLHALFNRLKVIKAERRFAREIIIKAVFNHRPDGHLRAGEKLLHRFGQHMRAVMAHQIDAVFIGGGNHRNLGIGSYRPRQVNHFAIDLPCQCFFGQ